MRNLYSVLCPEKHQVVLSKYNTESKEEHGEYKSTRGLVRVITYFTGLGEKAGARLR